MGSLAMYGALAGVGSTVAKLGDEKAKSIAKQQEGDIAEAREQRIAQFNSGLRTKEQEAQNVFTGAQNDATRNTQKSIANQEQIGQNQRTEAELGVRQEEGGATRKLQGQEGDADRKNRIEVAKIQADAAKERVGTKDRFFIQKVQREDPPPLGVDGKPTGLIGKKYDVAVLTDQKTGETFEQKGDKFMAQGTDLSKYPAPKQSAIDKLYSGATTPEEFMAKAGYIPAQYFARQRK